MSRDAFRTKNAGVMKRGLFTLCVTLTLIGAAARPGGGLANGRRQLSGAGAGA